MRFGGQGGGGDEMTREGWKKREDSEERGT